MMRAIILIFLLLSKTAYLQENKVSKYANTITAKELMDNLYVYSSDYFQGRETGTLGQKRAIDFLQNFYTTSGIASADGTQNYLQPMKLKNQMIYMHKLKRKKIIELDQKNKWQQLEFFKSNYIASKDVNAWLGMYKVL